MPLEYIIGLLVGGTVLLGFSFAFLPWLMRTDTPAPQWRTLALAWLLVFLLGGTCLALGQTCWERHFKARLEAVP